MNDFKEWLSDYLRYFVLILALLLALGAIFLGVKLYQSTQTAEGDPDSITIVEGTEVQTESETQTETEIVTESEGETEKVTEKLTEQSTEKATESAVKAAAEKDGETSETQTEKSTVKAGTQTAGTASETEPIVVINTPETQRQSETQRQTEAPVVEIVETEPPTEPPTEPIETEPPEPVYLTMTGTCYMRSYPDYGDNIMGTYYAGTVVEFLGEEAGWYKVQVDGNVGYMGPKFFR